MKRLFAFLLLVVACRGDVPTAVPGTLTVRLTAGGSNDGALIVVVSGGAVTAVDPVGSYEVTSTSDAAGVHIMVVGNVAEGALVHLQVPDVTKASEYLAVIQQVADRSTFGLVDAAGYRATIDEFP